MVVGHSSRSTLVSKKVVIILIVFYSKHLCGAYQQVGVLQCIKSKHLLPSNKSFQPKNKSSSSFGLVPLAFLELAGFGVYNWTHKKSKAWPIL
mmetsp:Transcript_12234/g.25251  ORF Transcript_12234/g.25251 Transcript_12234/m.25251 type:complete len:93 (+) Transcript_12234:82-360(+)